MLLSLLQTVLPVSHERYRPATPADAAALILAEHGFKFKFGRQRMFCQHHTLFFPALAVCLCLAGCRQERIPVYDTLEMQLTHEAFSSLQNSAPEGSMRLLTRLESVVPESAFPALALKHEQERFYLQQFNDALHTDRLDEAATVLREADMELGVTPRTEHAQTLLAASRTLARVLQRQPFTESQPLATALTELAPYASVLRTSPAYRSWYTRKRRQLHSLRTVETDQIFSELALSLDLAAVTGRHDVEIMAAQILALESEHPGAKLVSRVSSSSVTGLIPVSERETSACRYRRAVLDGLILERIAGMSKKTEEAVVKNIPQRHPASLSGIVLAIKRDAYESKYTEAVSSLRDLVSTVPLDESHLRSLLTEHVLPAQQFRASCWRTPVPSVPDILNRITQLRDYKERKAFHD